MQNRVAEYLEAKPRQLLDRYIEDERSHAWRAGFGLGLIIGLALGLLALAIDAWAMPTHLTWTNSRYGQTQWRGVGEDGDSVTFVDCARPDTTKPIRHLRKVYLYGQPITGGGFRLVDSLDVRGREGLLDSIPIPYPGNFYVRSTNLVTGDTLGWSCESDVVTVYPDVTTGVEVDTTRAAPFPPIAPTWHDVQGRRVWTPRGTGIFFQRIRGADGQVWARRVFIRASRPYTFGRWKPQGG